MEIILRWFGHIKSLEKSAIVKRVYEGECIGRLISVLNSKSVECFKLLLFEKKRLGRRAAKKSGCLFGHTLIKMLLKFNRSLFYIATKCSQRFSYLRICINVFIC